MPVVATLLFLAFFQTPQVFAEQNYSEVYRQQREAQEARNRMYAEQYRQQREAQDARNRAYAEQYRQQQQAQSSQVYRSSPSYSGPSRSVPFSSGPIYSEDGYEIIGRPATTAYEMQLPGEFVAQPVQQVQQVQFGTLVEGRPQQGKAKPKRTVGKYEQVSSVSTGDRHDMELRSAFSESGGRISGVGTTNGRMINLPEWVAYYWQTKGTFFASAVHPDEHRAHMKERAEGQKTVRDELVAGIKKSATEWTADKIKPEIEKIEKESGELAAWVKEKFEAKVDPKMVARFMPALMAKLDEKNLAAGARLRTLSQEISAASSKLVSQCENDKSRAIALGPDQLIGDFSAGELREMYTKLYTVEREERRTLQASWSKNWSEALAAAKRTPEELAATQTLARTQAQTVIDGTVGLLERFAQEEKLLSGWSGSLEAEMEKARGARDSHLTNQKAIAARVTAGKYPKLPKDFAARLDADALSSVSEWKKSLDTRGEELAAEKAKREKELQAQLDKHFASFVEGQTAESVYQAWDSVVATTTGERNAFSEGFLPAAVGLQANPLPDEQVEQRIRKVQSDYSDHEKLLATLEARFTDRKTVAVTAVQAFDKEWTETWLAGISEHYLTTFEGAANKWLTEKTKEVFAEKPSEHFTKVVRENFAAHPTGMRFRGEWVKRWQALIQAERTRIQKHHDQSVAEVKKALAAARSSAWETAAATELAQRTAWQQAETAEAETYGRFKTAALADWQEQSPKWDASPKIEVLWQAEMDSYPRFVAAKTLAALRLGTRFDLSTYLQYVDPESGQSVDLVNVGQVVDVEALGEVAVVFVKNPRFDLAANIENDASLRDVVAKWKEASGATPAEAVITFRGNTVVEVLTSPRPGLQFGRFFKSPEIADKVWVSLYRSGETPKLVQQVAYEVDLRTGRSAPARLPEPLPPQNAAPLFQ